MVILDDIRELFETRRAEGKSVEDILREIFEKDMTVDFNELVEITGFDKLKIGRIKGQVMRWKKKQAPTSEATPPESEEEGIYKGESDVNKILKGILSSHPDIKPKHIAEVMDWAKLKGGLSPNDVISILSGLRGIDYKTAYMIATKYSLALAKEAQESSAPPTQILPGGMTPQRGQWPLLDSRQQFPGQPFTFDYSRQGGGQPGSSRFLTYDEYLQIEKDKQERERTVKLEDRIEKMGENVATMLDTFKKDIEGKLQAQAPTADVEVEEVPIDKDGNICDPDNMVSLRRITRPLGRRKEGSVVDDALKIVNTIRQQQPAKPEDSPTVVAMQKDFESTKASLKEISENLKETQKKLEEEKEKRAEERAKHLEDAIKELKGDLKSQQAATLEGGIGAAITQIASKEPMKTVERIFSTPGVPQATPEELTQPTEPLAQELGKKGLVTIVRERVRGR